MRGLGSIDLSAIGQAAENHQVRANPGSFAVNGFAAGEGYDPPAEFTFAGHPDQTTGYEYLHDDVAQQIASLIGATVVKHQPSNYPGKVPDANFLALPNGQDISAGVLATIFSTSPAIVGFDTECGYESMFKNSIPDSVLSDKCQAQFNASQSAQSGQATFDSTQGTGQVNYRNGQMYFGDNLANAVAGTETTATGQTVSTTPPSGQQVTTTTPGANVGSTSATTGSTSATTDATTSASTAFSLSSLPWWAYLGAAGALFFMMKKD